MKSEFMLFSIIKNYLSEISIVEKEERCLVTVDVDQDTTFEQEVELITIHRKPIQDEWRKNLWRTQMYMKSL